jgi:hypothetical protein
MGNVSRKSMEKEFQFKVRDLGIHRNEIIQKGTVLFVAYYCLFLSELCGKELSSLTILKKWKNIDICRVDTIQITCIILIREKYY